MQNNQVLNAKMRWILVFFILVSLGMDAYALSYSFTYKHEDYIFSSIVIIFVALFALFEIVLTLLNYRKTLFLFKYAFTDRGLVHPVPLISAVLVTIIGLSFTVPGLVIYLVRDDITIKSFSLVILSTGIYILVNCVFYYIYVLSFKRIMKESH